jgi:hypothetical protein
VPGAAAASANVPGGLIVVVWIRVFGWTVSSCARAGCRKADIFLLATQPILRNDYCPEESGEEGDTENLAWKDQVRVADAVPVGLEYIVSRRVLALLTGDFGQRVAANDFVESKAF